MIRASTLITRVAFLFLFAAVPAVANTITFNLQNLGSNTFRYTYTVSNDGTLGPGVSIRLFDILFDPALYDETSLTIVTPGPLNSQWSQQILLSVPGVPAAYDAYAISLGIPSGQSVTGFAVEFTWLGGPAGPGVQPFEIYDPNTFALLESGTTSANAAAVPEPSSLALLGIGLSAIVLIRGLTTLIIESVRELQSMRLSNRP